MMPSIIIPFPPPANRAGKARGKRPTSSPDSLEQGSTTLTNRLGRGGCKPPHISASFYIEVTIKLI